MITPRTTLVLLLGLALLIMAGGVWVARQEEHVRIDRDREALRHFSGEVQSELRRLETLYEEHLERLALESGSRDAFDIRQAVDALVGILQFSRLRRDGTGNDDLHVSMNAAGRLPVPMFAAPRNPGLDVPVLLSRKKLFNKDVVSGWIEEPGKPLMFWRRLDERSVAVFMIDAHALEAAVSRWLSSWASKRFAPVRSAGGPDQLRTSAGELLLEEGAAPHERPDLLIPLSSRLGSWELASWDRREPRVHYNPVVLNTTAALAVLVSLLGILIFIQQRRAAAEASQRVSFVNRVSHELRTPLTNILLNVDLAADAHADAPELSRRLDLVKEEVRRLGRLIENVLTFSRRERGQLRAEPCACVPAEVIAGVIEQFAPSFRRRGLEVRRTGDLTRPCRLDADAFAQIIGNLFSNLEKYVPGGVVKVAGSHASGELVVTVTDQGPGIPSEAAERIFRPFERLGSRVNEGASGTGLGLAIARDLAEMMGGSLRLIPGGRGASFELRLPAPPAVPIPTIAV